MYGLPTQFDVAVFVGKTLDLICYSANTISFSFTEDVIITIMGSFIYRQELHEISNKQSVRLLSSNLMGLIDKSVSRADGWQDGTLNLYFDNGHILTLLDDSQQYESYIIQIGNKEIVV
jgi:hypothetical protein